MKNIIICISTVLLLGSLIGCTQQSTKYAQAGSFRVQAVKDGVHRDMFTALSRSNYEIAKLTIQMAGEKMKDGTNDAAVDAIVNESIVGLTNLAKQRDFMVEWDRDYERANALKYVTVDTKLFSDIGILNYIGQSLSQNSQDVLNAWDEAKAEYETVVK